MSIIIPTLGRPTLQRTLESIQPQLGPGDQVYLVADGQAAVEKIKVAWQGDFRWPLCLVAPTLKAMSGNPGGTQRNAALDLRSPFPVSGDYFLWCGDDDIYLPGALGAIRGQATAFPGQPLMFCMKTYWGEVLWRDGAGQFLYPGNVGDHMFVAPNIPEKLGRFGPTYQGDFDFIQETVALHGGNLIWRPEVIVECRPK